MLSIILVAAGSGKRMNSSVPKQFITIENKTILQRTLEAYLFLKQEKEFIVVLHKDYLQEGEAMLSSYPTETIKLVVGGQERFHSVQNALSIAHSSSEIVLIHDGVRPFVSRQMIEQGINCCLKNQSAIPAINIIDSIREIDEQGQSYHKERSQYKLIQTPQLFNAKKIKESYTLAFSSNFTDDASVYEAAGNTIHLYEGEKQNIKITLPEDLSYAQFLIQNAGS
jgi:2-C-methyl-D-erythritol 4-phosphate cytidylyltransferase